MTSTNAVHECLFCPQTFNTAADKDDHVLRHFAQENCTECNRNLIRIGDKLYTLHDAATCIQQTPKKEHHSEANATVPSHEYEVIIPDLSNILTEDANALFNEAPLKAEQFPPSDELNDCIEQIHDIQDCKDIPLDLNEGCVTVKEEPMEQCDEITDNESTSDQISGSDDFRCEVCSKKFKSLLYKYKHMQSKQVPNIADYKCSRCHKLFMEKSLLQNHRCKRKRVGIHETDEISKSPDKIKQLAAENRLACNVCGKILTRNTTLERHKVLFHSPAGTIFCNVCCRIFDSRQERDAHKIDCYARRAHVPQTGNFKCDICSKEFKRKDYLSRHIRNYHSKKTNIKCDKCNTKFIQESFLRDHDCGQSSAEKEFYRSQKFPCEICGEEFSRANIAKHKSIAHGSGPTPCELCGKVLGYASLRRHRIAVHSPPGTIFCKFCFKFFPTEDGLRSHKSQCKLYSQSECDVCGKILASQIALTKHKISLHSSPGTIFCKSCVKVFKTLEELDEHKREKCLHKFRKWKSRKSQRN